MLEVNYNLLTVGDHYGGWHVSVCVYLSEKPLVQTEFCSPGPSVEHQVHVGDPSKQVSCSQVPQQVVDGVMEASVH